MSRCPTEEKLAAVAAGEIRGKERDALLSHVLGCARCREVALRYERLKFVLSHARRGADGKLAIELPSPSAGLRQRIHQAVRQESRQELARKNRIRALVEELLEDIFTPSHSVPEGVAVGYFATRPGRKERARVKATEERLKTIPDQVAVLLEAITEPALSDEERLKLLYRLVVVAGVKNKARHKGTATARRRTKDKSR